MTSTLTGTFETIEGKPTLRFERHLPHSVDRVWRAVTEPAELARWFVAPVEWGPELGEFWEAMGQRGEITELEAPNLLRWTWGDETYSFELSAEGEGSLLVFTHGFSDGSLGAQHASGWEAYFRRLDAHLDGDYLDEMEAHDGAEEVHERYAKAFGLDPEVGRAMFAKLRAGQLKSG